jgi:glucokinase
VAPGSHCSRRGSAYSRRFTAARDLIGIIDLGGTKIYSAVLDAHNRVQSEDFRATGAEDGCEAVLDRLEASLRTSVEKAGRNIADLMGAAIAAPGPVSAGDGHIINPPNLPGWGDVALGPLLAERLGVPMSVENDANAAALGEYIDGAGRGAACLIYVTLSTGIGGGIVIDGRLFRGPDGAAGEIGHMVIRPGGPLCGCGNQGCLEALASGTALAREGRNALAVGRAPGLSRIVAKDGAEVTAELVAQAAAEGDSESAAIIERAAEMLGLGFGNLVNLLNPDVIVVGGGASRIGAPMLGPAERVMREISVSSAGSRVALRPAALEYAAISGLAGLVRTGARG